MTSTTSEAANALQAMSDGLVDAIAQVGQSLVAIGHSPQSHHAVSGIHWQPDIFVAAEWGRRHQSDRKTMVLPDGRTVPAEVIGRDPALDLVVLRLENSGLSTVTPAAADSLKVGHWVVAVGRDRETGLSASMGIISNLGGAWRTMQGRTIDYYIRPDITLYPSLLGGALINTQGQVIGINLTGPRRQVVTLPAITLNRVVETLLETGHMHRGYLGVGLQPVELPQTLQQALDLPDTKGLIVVSLAADSPAEQAGMLIGDVVIRLADQPVADLRDVRAFLEPESIGQPVPFQIVRGGQRIDLVVTVGVHP